MKETIMSNNKALLYHYAKDKGYLAEQLNK